MIRLMILLSVTLSFSAAWSIDFFSTAHNPRGESVFPVSTTPLILSGVTISPRSGEQHLYVVNHSRDENGLFNLSGVKSTFRLNDVLSVPSIHDVTLHGVKRKGTLVFALVSNCQTEQCDTYLITLSDELSSASSIQLDAKMCATQLTLLEHNLISACGALYAGENFQPVEAVGETLAGKLDDSGELVSVLKEGNAVYMQRDELRVSLFSLNASDHVKCDISEVNAFWYYSCISGQSTLENDVSVDDYMLHRGRWGGLTEDVATYTSVDAENVTGELTGISAHYYEQHMFLLISTDQQRVFENWKIDGDRYSTRSLKVATTQAPSVWSAPDVAFSVFNVFKREDGKNVVAVFDGLPNQGLPQLADNISAGAMTGESYSETVNVQDEHVLPGDINIIWSGLPAFLSWDNQQRELYGDVPHSAAGEFPVSLTMEGQPGQIRNVDFTFTVNLTPADLTAFEPTLFSRWELTDPISLSAIQSVSALEFLEDTPVSWQFERVKRSESELFLSWSESLPSWLVWDPVSLTLSGTPEQSDVGEFVLTLNAQDLYAPERTMVYRFPFHVIEVDEPPKITSNGNAELNTGQEYHYTLVVVDEETELADITVNPVLYPRWLTWDRNEMSLSGRVPKDEQKEAHLVQFVISDEAGHTLLHQFTLTVIPEPDAKSGGSSSWVFLLGLVLISLRLSDTRKR